MKKIYLPLVISLLAIAACNKDKTEYYQAYGVTYFPVTDSFIAVAAFLAQGQAYEVLLGKNEEIRFNGRPHDEIGPFNKYLWRGKGKPDGRFTLKKRRKEYVNTIAASVVNDYELIVPATISRAQGAVVRLKGYISKPSYSQSVSFTGKTRSFSLGIQGDSVVVLPAHLKDMKDEVITISFSESQRKDIQQGDGDMSGSIGYLVEHKKMSSLVP